MVLYSVSERTSKVADVHSFTMNNATLLINDLANQELSNDSSADHSDTDNDAVPLWIFYASSATLGLIAVPGVTFNLLAIYVYIKDVSVSIVFNGMGS